MRPNRPRRVVLLFASPIEVSGVEIGLVGCALGLGSLVVVVV